MALLPHFGALASRLPRRTVRLRLTLLSGGLFLASGVALLAVTYLVVRFTFTSASIHSYTSAHPPSGSGVPGSTLGPPPGLPSSTALQAQDASQRTADLHQLLVVSSLALVVMAALSVGLGWFVAGRALRPLRTITAAAREVSSSSLSRRLALVGPDDELKELADTFDDLLDRLDWSFQSQRQFIANASHELRTPLTLERVLLEAVLTDAEATNESLRTTCERLLVATTEQERLIEALLTLATSQRGIERWQPIDIGAVAEQHLLVRGADVERLGLRVETRFSPAPTSGDPILVERLIANLVDNALRYNVRDGLIEIVTGNEGDLATIWVSNTGPVIPAAEVDPLFQPFRRLRDDRTVSDGGHGLGMSIVASIARAHLASISARARPDGGLEVGVRFPVRSAHVSGRPPVIEAQEAERVVPCLAEMH